MCNVITGRVPVTKVCRGKATSITYSKCVSVALVIQHVKRVRSIILSSVDCPTLLYFFPVISSVTRFSENKNVTKNKIYFEFLYKFYLT